MAVNAVIKMYLKGDSIAYNDIITKGSTIDLDVGDGYGNQIFETPDLLGMDSRRRCVYNNRIRITSG